MDRDSLLPPALSESLHIPPLWLPTDHDLNGGGPRIAFEKNSHKFQASRTKLRSSYLKTNYDHIQDRKISQKLHKCAI